MTTLFLAVPTIVHSLILVGAAVLLMILSGVASFFILRSIDRSQKRDGLSQADEIIHRAELDAENHRREVEIALKEEAMQQKEKIEAQSRAARQENHEKERALLKRQDAIDKQSDDLRKQEKLVETTQRKLADRIEEQRIKGEELQKVFDQQKKILYDLSGLSKEEATTRLLRNLETELHDEAGSIILKHEKICRRAVRAAGAQYAPFGASALCRGAYGRSDHQYG